MPWSLPAAGSLGKATDGQASPFASKLFCIAMRLLRIVFSLCLIFASVPSHSDERPDALPAKADSSSLEDVLREGIALYTAKDYAKAKETFVRALEKSPGNVAAATDLALSYCQLGEMGPCLAYFRLALTKDPQNPEARQGLEFALTKLETKEIPHRLELFESLRENGLNRFSLDQFLAIAAACFFAGAWITFAAVGRRRRALEDQQAPPAFPMSSPVLLALAAVFIVLSSLKIYDSGLPRGTILEAKIPVLSAPTTTGVPLFDLYAGFEVILKDWKDEWVQVTYPGGLTGWIPKKAVLRTSGGDADVPSI